MTETEKALSALRTKAYDKNADNVKLSINQAILIDDYIKKAPEIEILKDCDEYELYINGWYIQNISPLNFSPEAKEVIKLFVTTKEL